MADQHQPQTTSPRNSPQLYKKSSSFLYKRNEEQLKTGTSSSTYFVVYKILGSRETLRKVTENA